MSSRRPIFVVRDKKPLVIAFNVEFTWAGGFAKSQKQKNVVAMHTAYQRVHPEAKLLEISRASTEEMGTKLSAFNLPITIDGKTMTVECAFQGSKVFFSGGPYTDLYDKTSKEAKKDERLKNSGNLTGFELNGVKYPITPKTAFYDWIYISALKQNKELSDYILQFDGFTDVEYKPERQFNCQARSCAYYVALVRSGEIDNINSFEEFVKICY